MKVWVPVKHRGDYRFDLMSRNNEFHAMSNVIRNYWTKNEVGTSFRGDLWRTLYNDGWRIAEFKEVE